MIAGGSPDAYDCAQVYVLLYEYLDAALKPDRRLAVEAHLAACAHCAEIAKLQRDAQKLAHFAANESVPAGMATRLHRLITSDRPTPEGAFPASDYAPGGASPVAWSNATISEEDAALARQQMA